MLDRSTHPTAGPTAVVPRVDGPRGPSRARVLAHAVSSGALRPLAVGPGSSQASLVGASCSLAGLVAWLGWFSSVLTATRVEVRG